jgi:alkylation response protein AidB-like acyl-CoA dehydrogenase
MDFGLSEDQLLLDQTIRSFLSDRVPITRVRELRDQSSGRGENAGCVNDPAIWNELAELGMTGILIPESHGGSALGLLDAAIVCQALGYAVTPTPFLTSAVMAPVALGALDREQTGAWLAGIASGEVAFGLAVTETFSIREGAGVVLDSGRLRGKAMMALDACQADYLLLAIAASPGDARSGGDQLAVIRRDAPGLAQTRLATIDATRCTSELQFDGVAPEAVFENAGGAIARMLDAGRIALAADSLGACESMLEQSVTYAQQRKQFDRLIGSFQAVKHLCAEMVAELEPARSLLWYSAHAFDTLPDEAPLMACHALAHVSEIGREIASVATQVHGGIGWTDEQNLHFWFKRIGVGRHLLGGPELLRERAAELQGLAAAS